MPGQPHIIENTPQFRAMWAEGVPVAEIARAYDVAPATVSRTARYFSLPPRTVRPRAIRDEAEFRRLWDDGMTLEDIGAHYGISRNSVARYARTLGLSRQPGPKIIKPEPEEKETIKAPADLIQRMSARGLKPKLIQDLANSSGYADLRRAAEKHCIAEARALSLWHEVRMAV